MTGAMDHGGTLLLTFPCIFGNQPRSSASDAAIQTGHVSGALIRKVGNEGPNPMTAILGISAFYHDSAAVLVVDGDIVARG